MDSKNIMPWLIIIGSGIIWVPLFGTRITGLYYPHNLLRIIYILIVAGIVFLVRNSAFQASKREKSEIDSTTSILLYTLSFFIPLAGFIVGAIYVSRDEEHYKHVGKNCLIFSVLNIILWFIMIAAILSRF